MKKFIQLIILSFSFVVSMQVSATLITSGPIITNPTSTDDLWTYSYIANNTSISGSTYYYNDVTQFSGVIQQGYVTGNNTNWPLNDAFLGSNGFRESHIFETYIVSAIDQTVTLSMGGDDGHSIFIDDIFKSGAGFGLGTQTDLVMDANTTYKITLALANYTGPWHVNASLSGTDEQLEPWGGKFSGADNISMNAVDDFDPGGTIPEPATLALMALGLAGIGYRRKAK